MAAKTLEEEIASLQADVAALEKQFVAREYPLDEMLAIVNEKWATEELLRQQLAKLNNNG